MLGSAVARGAVLRTRIRDQYQGTSAERAVMDRNVVKAVCICMSQDCLEPLDSGLKPSRTPLAPGELRHRRLELSRLPPEVRPCIHSVFPVLKLSTRFQLSITLNHPLSAGVVALQL